MESVEPEFELHWLCHSFFECCYTRICAHLLGFECVVFNGHKCVVFVCWVICLFSESTSVRSFVGQVFVRSFVCSFVQSIVQGLIRSFVHSFELVRSRSFGHSCFFERSNAFVLSCSVAFSIDPMCLVVFRYVWLCVPLCSWVYC